MGERSGAPRASALHQSSFRNLRLRFNYRSQMSQLTVTHPSRRWISSLPLIIRAPLSDRRDPRPQSQRALRPRRGQAMGAAMRLRYVSAAMEIRVFSRDDLGMPLARGHSVTKQS